MFIHILVCLFSFLLHVHFMSFFPLQSTSSVPEIREAMDNYLRHRVNDLTGQNISSYMKKIMFRHLSGLIVFGTIAGFVIGLIAQALRFTINPEFIIDSVIVEQ